VPPIGDRALEAEVLRDHSGQGADDQADGAARAASSIPRNRRLLIPAPASACKCEGSVGVRRGRCYRGEMSSRPEDRAVVDEETGPEHYLLGHVTFFDLADGIRIVDWRVAPVARIFYRYREGDRFEEKFPGRLVEGVVIARRIVVIENGELTRVIGDDLLL